MANIGKPDKRIQIEPMPVPEEAPVIEPSSPVAVPTTPDPELIPA